MNSDEATASSTLALADDAALDALYAGLDAADLSPLWTITEELLTPEPRPAAVPWLWAAASMKPLAREAIRLVPVERGGERRVLALRNPGLGGRPYAVGTLWGALQCLGPNEVAPAHRHTPGAIRFVLEGEGVWTTVDGDSCDMRPGDLILTPSGQWHDHTNGGDREMFWFDGLDLPMIQALDGVFFEHWPGPGESQPQPAEHNTSERLTRGKLGSRYSDGAVTGPLTPRPSELLIYRWSDTAAELERLGRESDDPLLVIEYTNPETGASVLPTMACALHRVRGQSRATRRSGNAVYVVYSGQGTSVIDGQLFTWGAGDMFVVPSWAAVEHNAAQADLFVLTDEPVLRALGIARRQVLPEQQKVTGEFSRSHVNSGRGSR
ncbi:gentisate 1,2-dioxygenase [Amycolatopsis sp. WAC 04197]|uniref:cupin domain-containing protein n=1 Tax=Amycolatopsis sp. WAC 04197 TaxID=2203199 RepID=UPI000F78A914|nr:cupin domain-containing protein [Amycolatopsis sp. WAC 04197]RSN45188.1 gentisate 1,2-dioxygenase [Amycolatopsis sp. WAC 04197]